MFDIATELRAGHFGIRIPVGVTDFAAPPPPPKTVSAAHPASYIMDTGVISRE